MAPTSASPRVWGLSGQSNAVAVRSFLAPYATIEGTQQNATAIVAWQNGQPLWENLRAALVTQPPSAFIWWQGEMDNVLGTPDYFAQLDDLLGRVRLAARNPSLPIVLVGVNHHSGQDAFRAAQESFAQARGLRFVRSDDLPQPSPGDVDIPSGEIVPADVESYHLSAAGYQVVASRIAAALTY
jgi:hypothetical protein